MNTAPLISHYKDPYRFISIEEAREIIEDLETDLRGCKSFYRRNPKSVTKEEIEEEKEIEYEIYYYQTRIFHTKQTYKEDPASYYGYSLRIKIPSVTDSDSYSDSDSDSYEEEQPSPVTQPSAETGPLENKVNAIGGLFNQEKQSNVIDNHVACLFGKESPSSSIISDESIFPTTRQGDANEEGFRRLKQQVSKLEETVNVLLNLLQKK